MEEVLQLRFSERDKAFTEALLTIKNEMNARGLLRSGNTVKAGHDALLKELVESRQLIVDTIYESLTITKPSKVDKKLTDIAKESLNKRKEFLESYYQDQMKVVISSLQNKAMHAAYTTLDEAMPLNIKELEIDLAQAYEKYISSRGATLYQRVINQFLDRPLVVIAIITISAVGTIMGFLAVLGVL